MNDQPSSPTEVPVAELQRLIAMGRPAGTITVDEVLVAMGSPEPTPAFIDAVTELLGSHGIVVDPEVPVDHARASDEELARPEPPAATARPRPVRRLRPRTSELTAAARSSSTSDPVRMYLKEIGRVPLLSGAEEVALAKRVEAGLAARARLVELVHAWEAPA